MWLYSDFYQPVMRLQRNTRRGARVHKLYEAANTRYHRLLESGMLAPEQRDTMAKQFHKLNSGTWPSGREP